MEQPRVEVLISLLEEQGKEPSFIIEVLANILKQQIMYGGSLEDKLHYHIVQAKRSL